MDSHQWLQPAQLEAAHPLHDDADADELTVSPWLPLEIKPQADIRRLTSWPWQTGQLGSSAPKTKHSKLWSHFSQWYS
jgi:hypothetical protein